MSDVLNVVAVGHHGDELFDNALAQGRAHFGDDAILEADLDHERSERERGTVPPEAEASNMPFFAYAVVRKVGEAR
ncbi:hypothetical protein [Nonomuraea wenchangensis]|uniref:Uncharacterized protein n=1 Tax=Nonomuraea wenchangensis TaxID=568860 RepID=A0A1I0LTL0_9ACTN|nr:hypothetical protein [Nonomuraea wenchangensis]SEU46521.1 hypothetical protein SAMN05421811_12764 [Nonomuraea wenchangensis]